MAWRTPPALAKRRHVWNPSSSRLALAAVIFAACSDETTEAGKPGGGAGGAGLPKKPGLFAHGSAGKRNAETAGSGGKGHGTAGSKSDPAEGGRKTHGSSGMAGEDPSATGGRTPGVGGEDEGGGAGAGQAGEDPGPGHAGAGAVSGSGVGGALGQAGSGGVSGGSANGGVAGETGTAAASGQSGAGGVSGTGAGGVSGTDGVGGVTGEAGEGPAGQGGESAASGQAGEPSAGAGQGGEGAAGPVLDCSSVTCGEHAACDLTTGVPACHCDSAYENVGGDCVPYAHGLEARPTNATCVAPAEGTPEETPIALEGAFPGISMSWPVTMVQVPNTNGFAFAEQDGYVRFFEDRPDVSSTELVLDISATVNAKIPDGVPLARVYNGELGLVGLTFHPNFPATPEIFVSYTYNHRTAESRRWWFRISRFKWLGTPIDPASEEILIDMDLPGPHHHAGTLGFDPSGYLMFSIGEGDVPSNAQPLNTLLGKLSRIDIDGTDTVRGTPYRIPEDNPFASGGGSPEIWASGFRNPWKWSFDRETGDLWLADVGLNDYEEVDRIEPAGNYGWPIFEGPFCRSTMGACEDEALLPPVISYFHNGYPHQGGGNAVTGGYVYRGAAIPDLQGSYVYSDFNQGLVMVARDAGGGTYQSEIAGQTNWMISSFAEDAEGELYALPYAANAKIQRLVKHHPSAPGPAAQLSETGCVDPADPILPAEGTIPYELNVPFWSDGATKHRWFNVPEGLTITQGSDGDFQFPVGSVLVKTFERGGRKIETRLLMHHADGWAGYSYAWNEAQTDATLLATGKTVALEDGPWTFPGRTDCLVCHTSAAGFTLGLETAQLNRTTYYPETGRLAQQLTSLEAIGLFDTPLPSSLPHLARLEDAAEPLDAKARSYLHANCAHCHRPLGPTGVDMDFRFGVALSDMRVCDVAPQRGDLGIEGAARLAAGHPESSIIAARIDRVGVAQMPPLGRNLIDAGGATLVKDWIASLTSCPEAP